MIGGGRAWLKREYWCWKARDRKRLMLLNIIIYQGLCCLLSILYFVPILCSLVLVVNVMHFYKYITLVPLLDFISLMQLPCVVVLVECWTCKWYFALTLLACMSRCSFLVWIIIVVTIYSDCSFLVKPYFIALNSFAWSHCACFICISSFLLTMIVLCCCFQELLFRMVLELHKF